MTRWLLSFLLHGILLPLGLLAGATLRQNGLSYFYLVLLLVNPFFPVPTVKSMFGWTGMYQKSVLIITILNMISIFSFQIVLIAHPPYGTLVTPFCSILERYLRYIGFLRLDGLDVLHIGRNLLPEIIVLTLTIIVHTSCKSLNPWLFEEQLLPITEVSRSQQAIDVESKVKKHTLMVTIGKYATLLTLFLSGAIYPSIINGVYFISFLVIMTWWACNKPLGRPFAYFLRFLQIFSALHVTILFIYQMQWAQELIPRDSELARYLGLQPLLHTTCQDPRVFQFVVSDWDHYVNPFSIVLLYYILSFETSAILTAPVESLRETGMTRQLSTRLSQKGKLLRNQASRWRSATRKVRDHSRPTEEHLSSPSALTETTPLIRGRESSKKGTRRGLVQDAMGSVTVMEVADAGDGDHRPDDGERIWGISQDRSRDAFDLKPRKATKTEQTGLCETIFNFGASIVQIITQSSYLATNIIMMTWSITYHSWLTFILLLWASILWLVPNQRKVMLRSSPFLVFYAICLLMSQYLYSMNLDDSELPETVQGVNLKQIGFQKVVHFPIQPLSIKVLYTVLFWITLKQYNKEKWEAKNQSALADISAPFQIGLGPAAVPQPTSKSSEFVQKLGEIVRTLLVKFWIWIVACILFAIGIVGDRITIFRIIYMSMALIFILTFQYNWALWRNLMYSFWLVLIIYSMLILIVTYTYQFDNFDDYWEEYLHVPKQLQKDIGLERFDTKELFVKLLTPTVFVIITVVQVHYFHHDFLAISDIKSRGQPTSGIRTSTHYGAKHSSMIGETPERKIVKVHFSKRVQATFDFIWLFMELHLLKWIMLSIMLLAATDVCAAHIVLVILAVIGILLNTKMQTLIAHLCSTIVAILIIAKMIYQINYINHDNWNISCAFSKNDTIPPNTANWVGFRKTSKNESLAELLKGYIGIILIITVHAVVVRRQKFHRYTKGRISFRPYVIFARITHTDIDKNVPSFLKYMMNYGFFRFGVEISLIAIVALIGIRMDFYAALYGLILCILITPNRRRLSRFWPLLLAFIMVTIPLQYLMAVGAPPQFCLSFPWTGVDQLANLREWMFLPDPLFPPYASKIICDFIVLMLVSRQSLVFKIEKRHRNDDYIGGSNKPITEDFEDPSFVNPVPDFICITRSVLDVLKRVLLSAFFWLSLAVVFLAGTNRVNIFSLGYLIGAFIFLWQGNDLYLRPIKTILVWWNFLLAYNVGVIFAKTLLQIVGCIFLGNVKTSACWIIQLFGIACIRKFKSDVDSQFTPGDCRVQDSEVGLAWDGCCFAMLLLQRRLFCSYYFIRIIDEAKAMAILASRGAELIEDLSHKQVEAQQESERQILEKIKNKMDRIKASQKRLQGPNYKEPESHFIAIRSGDYFMFDDYEEDMDLISEFSVASITSTLSDENVDLRRTSISQLISSALRSGDLKAAIREAAQTNLKPIGDSTKSAVQKEAKDSSDDSKPGPSTGSKKKDLKKKKRWKVQSEADSIVDDAKLQFKEPSSTTLQSSTEYTYTHIDIQELPPSWKEKMGTFFHYLAAFFSSIMVTITRKLNATSRDYRYIMKTLSVEKKLILITHNFSSGVRIGPSRIWRPVLQSQSSIPSEGDKKDVEAGSESPEITPVDKDENRMEKWLNNCSPLIFIDPPSSDEDLSMERKALIRQRMSLGQFEEEGELKAIDQPPLFRLILATWFAVLSHSELVCYFVIFLHQIRSPTLLSLPLPLMVFFWGTLTVPRPTKLFWVTIIAYTEIVVVIKCICQFEFLWWSGNVISENDPFEPQRIIGVERKPGTYAYYDLLLLLVVFFHRAMLKSLGLWKSSSDSVAVQEDEGSPESFEQFGSAELSDMKKSRRTNSNSSSSSTSFSSVSHSSDELDGKRSDIRFDVLSKKLHRELPRYSDHVEIILPKYRSLRPCKDFFKRLLESSGRVTSDVYAYMFFCDFFNFFVVIFGFASFGSSQGDGGVSQYFQENKVPVAFLIMLILQFGLIIMDRTLYLRKFILGKIIFQYILVLGIHLWMFFILPAVTKRVFNSALPPQMWYMVKCFYLLLSAYQIRCGYPTRIYGNFLCKSYNYINYALFKIFMAVPFVFELRTLMDWIWTDTSMTLSDWLKMEDIFAHVFQIKCLRRAESDYPQPRGVKKVNATKYLVGGGCLAGIIAVIWFPLVLFALGNTVGRPNLPTEVTVSIRIGPYTPIYSYTAQNDSILTLTEAEWDIFTAGYYKSRTAQTALSNYLATDVGVITLNSHSTGLWSISPPDNKTMLTDLYSDKPLKLRFEWTIIRAETMPEQPRIITEAQESTISATNPARLQLARFLQKDKTAPSAGLQHLLPKFLKVTNKGFAKELKALATFYDDNTFKRSTETTAFRDLEVQMHWVENSVWWQVLENNSDTMASYLKLLPKYDPTKLVIYTFNDKVFPPTLKVLSGKGIVGLYTTFVIVIHSVIRGFFTGISFKIMFDDMPNVDRIYQLCLDIYLVRESRELDLEEDLFAKLVFLYRSPETLIKWTRPPEEPGNDEEGNPLPPGMNN